MMLVEEQSSLIHTLIISLSILASAIGVIGTIWRVILKTVNGHLADFASNVTNKMDEAGREQTKEITAVMKEEGNRTREVLTVLLQYRPAPRR